MFGSRAVVLILLIASGWQWSGAALIHAKAALAPILIERAWQNTLTQGQENPGNSTVKPWPWADTWPVARLRLPAQAVDQFVLAGTHGASLPFGPGHMTGSAAPTDSGTIVLAGHRDTHFRFLHKLAVGDLILLQVSADDSRRFRVTGIEVANADLTGLVLDHDQNQLVLVTCIKTSAFGFRGPQRLVVTALEA